MRYVPEETAVIENVVCILDDDEYRYSFEVERYFQVVNYSHALKEKNDSIVFLDGGYVIHHPFTEKITYNGVEAIKANAFSIYNQTNPPLKSIYEIYGLNCHDKGFLIIKYFPENSKQNLKNDLEEISTSFIC